MESYKLGFSEFSPLKRDGEYHYFKNRTGPLPFSGLLGGISTSLFKINFNRKRCKQTVKRLVYVGYQYPISPGVNRQVSLINKQISPLLVFLNIQYPWKPSLKVSKQIEHSILASVCLFVCLFDLILYVPSTIVPLNRDGFSWVEPVLS